MNLDTPCKRSASNTDWFYLTLLRKFQHECIAAVLRALIAFVNTDLSFFFVIDLVFMLDLLFIKRDEFMPWMNTIDMLMSFPSLEFFCNFPM